MPARSVTVHLTSLPTVVVVGETAIEVLACTATSALKVTVSPNRVKLHLPDTLAVTQLVPDCVALSVVV